ncbi:S9 family peptidase [Mucilaginibacter hurinus]|uniref:S9 family peptidase n=1 Tax=Mucilaginibacter hurinus TaxID=2201324 RepID=A0A367GNE2_9SPHI|nr:S9 family peptidase [Mucilaginibacter hurinus]RCH54830.1 S9 family peptidase [Mucilaginibacter hurinus]
MHRLRFFLYILIAASIFSCDEKVVKIPVVDFFKTPEKTFFRISPDGKYISYLKSYKSKQNLYIQSLESGKGFMATSFTDNPVTDYLWTLNNKIIFTQDIVASDSLKMFALNVKTLNTYPILAEHNVRYRLFNANKLQPDVLTISLNKRDEAIFDVYHLNINTGLLKPYIINPGDVVEWYTDVDGKIRLARASDGVNATIIFRPNEKAMFKPVITSNFKNSVRPIAFIGKSNNFYALSNLGRDKMALVEINAQTGKEKLIYKRDNADVAGIEYFRDKHRLDYASWEEATPRKHFFNDTLKNVFNTLLNHLRSNEIRVVDRDSTEKKFVILTYSDHNPGSYYLFDVGENKLSKLGDVNSSIKPADLSDMQPIAFKASDGLQINGYLTLPKGRGKTNLPLVVMPHGGPWTRNTWGYNAEVQFLANRGYAVLQVNFRGSTGYGKAFRNAGFKQVGGKIQQDITDGVNWMVSQKVANPQKIAIYGGGFGGFSALHGVSFHPELYKCAVVQHGLINFFTYIKDAPPFYKPYLKMIYEMVGNPETDAELFRAISPVFHADKIKVPLIIFQGGKDTHTNIAELNQFVLELRKKNVPVNYILKNDERTIFSNEANRIEMYTEIEKFLEANLMGKN